MSRLEDLLKLPGPRNAIGNKTLSHRNARALAATSLRDTNISYYARQMKTHHPLSKNNGYINLNQAYKIPYLTPGTYYIINERRDDKNFFIGIQLDENDKPIIPRATVALEFLESLRL